MTTIQEKVVLITGASSGIGEATARLLARRGAKVVLGARRTDRLASLAAEITATGGTASFQRLDVTHRPDMEAFAEFALETHEQIDVLVNAAGVMPMSPLWNRKIEEWELMIDVNLRGVLLGIAAVLPTMQEQGWGHIVNVAPVAMHGLSPGSAVYHGTQYAVNAISEGLRQEHAGRLHVTVVSPDVHGPIDPLAERIAASYARERMRTNRRIAVPVDAVARSIAGAIEGYGITAGAMRPPTRQQHQQRPRPAEYAQ
ncbi:SDR family oxidoreductase [Variovorax guangxiensis]|uniref:NADP-dependent 3-hydroxy acid dehydrogenase YdfG n=1 Tax=Variovorax guangxiensis TaxID=1775474 RepID=A0A840FTJ0_9BURK|nr:SDR family oxidoreductase [Variovorax guangxiensis]MBB4220028.1 NADP-dependent 3-hydroxy acid dehydrogenase YdfG [Variovorax guangxiensis]